MKKFVKEKWIAALRSGKFKQGQTSLKSTEGNYCCLGVLAEVVVGDVYTVQHVNGAEFLSEDFLDRIGLNDRQQMKLARMNDGGFDLEDNPIEAKSFAEIADYIERNL